MDCTPRSRCGNARDCEPCGKIRQKRAADQAEKIEAAHGQLTMTVLVPSESNAAAIKALHASFMRRALTPAGIWTVEQGEQFGGLHLNILSPKPAPARWRNCKTYSELVQVTARDAAAYIAKRSGMPALEQYSGRLYGAWGKVGDILASEAVAVTVQAAAIESRLNGGQIVKNYQAQVVDAGSQYRTEAEEMEGWTEGAPVGGRRVWWSNTDPTKYTWKPEKPVLSKNERAEIMRKHLPNIYAAVPTAARKVET